MVLLGKISFQNSNPPATVNPGLTGAALGRFRHRAHSGEGSALAHRVYWTRHRWSCDDRCSGVIPDRDRLLQEEA
jgi:hypothetical protein